MSPLLAMMACIVFVSNSLCAQSTFQKTFGGDGDDKGVSICQTEDGGFIIAGVTKSKGAGGDDAYLLKIDSLGNLLWEKTYGGAKDDAGWYVRQTLDGGIIVAGFTQSYGMGQNDVYLFKTDNAGNLQWQKTFGGEGDDYGWFLDLSNDGGFVIAAQKGMVDSEKIDAYLIKTDEQGDLIWEKSFGGEKIDRIFSVEQTDDYGYIAAGITYSFGAGGRDGYLLKTDEHGNERWFRTFGDEGYNVSHAAHQTTDGGYIVIGYTEKTETKNHDLYLIKTDKTGRKVWDNIFGGPGPDHVLNGVQTADGGYILSGFTASMGAGDADAYLVKTDDKGNLVWHRAFGGTGRELGYSVQQSKDGGFILVGHTTSFGGEGGNVFVVKTNSSGNVHHLRGQSQNMPAN